MLYMIYSEDVANSLEKRRIARPAHIDRLQKLKDQGRVLVGGPLAAIDSEEPGDAGMTGSLVIAEFESLEAAKSWAEVDPYMLAGVYHKTTVKPFKKTI
ncbi:YciI family protein [Rouxiella badensis]|uniref:YciI family protein n=1 Tax=Rouxiella badensis TaxID=1646377 RepID=UPI001D13BD50|nr:YciI family protein [Rouxiella badensis]MCC3717899.1 YciI family protein [Rouxiella badensis]MCC3730086.1 YciI family protein [Rouxiella badensis]